MIQSGAVWTSRHMPSDDGQILRNLQSHPMTAADFRRMALMLTLEQQAAFGEEAPEVFLPIPGGWGKMGHTHIRLAASEDVLTGALRTAWRLRIDKNARQAGKKPHVTERSGVTDKKLGKRRL